MSTVATDTHRLLAALKSTGKSANFTAEEIAGTIPVAQEGAELPTKAAFDARMAASDAPMGASTSSSAARSTRCAPTSMRK